MKPELKIGMIGQGFMGRAHSNAWTMLERFFDVPYHPVLKAVAGTKSSVKDFAETWGYESYTQNWRELVQRDDIDVIDVGAPTYLHKEMVLAAVQAGKHVVCEKPCALTSKEAQEMADAAKKAGVVHYLNHNYRRVPAVTFAKKLIDEGRLGQIYHWRGSYFQDWILDASFPLTWQLQSEKAGGGPLYDLASHGVDLARYLVGEPVSVMAKCKTFVARRPLSDGDAAVFSKGSPNSGPKEGKVTVDDAAFLVLEFENGALGSIDVSRFAAGCKNQNKFEIYGSRGALKFDLENLNELQFLDLDAPTGEQGFRTIMATSSAHPYAGAWWGPGHIIGYENTFFHAFADFVQAVQQNQVIQPNLFDGVQIARVLEAAQKSSRENRCIQIEKS